MLNLFATLLRFEYLCRMNFKPNWDALGITTSVACAIHCAVLPVLLTSLPIFGINIINNTAFEYFMILLAFAVGSFSLIHGYRRHHSSAWPLILFTIGILLLFAKQLWHDYTLWLLPFAVSFIVSGHFYNLKLCRKQAMTAHEKCTDHAKLFPNSKT